MYISIIQPTNCLYIAFDGVAPSLQKWNSKEIEDISHIWKKKLKNR